MDGKTCTRCGVIKPLEEFPPNLKMRDGRDSHCRQCGSEKSRISMYKRQGREVPASVKVYKPRGQVIRDDHGIITERECLDCHEIKSRSEFPANRSLKGDRIHPYCKPCQNIRTRESRVRVHGNSREYHLRHRYGITGVTFDEMLEGQGGLCAICKTRTAEHVDHDHETGNVRALLCFTCNVCLGNSRDDASILRAAADYLDAWALLLHPERSWRELETGVFERIPA